ncbi:hypothetical protein HF086_017267 [Spodoptera exigua]|uniref:Gag-like protein n=1 Tax=Spodoptera exigua TaxID=7107 RepID=A0A922S815_SPOEX|nr:hypothetical protein HF086_017267 [Spodoptera exigua]
MSVASAVSGKRLRKRPREGVDSGSESALSDTAVPAPRREAAAAIKAAAVAEKLEEDERQIAALTKRVTKGRVARLSESSSVVTDVGVEAEELPASDLNQRMVDAVAAIRRVSKVSKGLSGCSQKALKEATASIMESAQVLLTRSTSEETALLRAQNKKLATQLAELRKEHEDFKEEMANFRREQLKREVGLPHITPQLQPQATSETSKQQPSQEMELTRLIRQEMASFNARFSVLEGKILRPPLAADQRSTQAPTYAAQVAAPRAAQPAQAAATQNKSTTAASGKRTEQQQKKAKLAKKAVVTAQPAIREPAIIPEAETGNYALCCERSAMAFFGFGIGSGVEVLRPLNKLLFWVFGD